MKIKDKKKWMLRDKGISRYNYRVHDGEHYDRAYVKKLDEEVTFLPFSRSCTLDPWDDDYYHGMSTYPERWLEKQVGKDAKEAYEKFVSLGWHDVNRREGFWNGYSGVDPEYVDSYRHRRYYVDEDGLIRRYSRDKSGKDSHLYLTTEQWFWNRDNPLPDRLFDDSEKGMKKLPKKYWVGYNGKVLLLSVYIFPTHPDRPGGWDSCYFGIPYKEVDQRKIDTFNQTFRPASVRTYGGYIKHTYISVTEAEREWHRIADND